MFRSQTTKWLLRNRRGLGLSFALAHSSHLLALAATSSDAAFTRLGARRWRLLHTLGSYYLWIVFAQSYFPRALESAAHFLFLAMLAISLALRATRRVTQSRMRG